MAQVDRVRLRDVARWARPVLGPEKPFITLTLIFGIGVALLSLATPIAVQLLINSIAYTGLAVPLFTLSAVMLVLLLFSAVLSAFRVYMMELFRRRFLARLVAEVTVRAVHARNPYFEDDRRVDLFNRYFDIMNLQKSLPKLTIGAFSIILQAVIGFIVTAFYHPLFLGFNVVFLLILYLVWVFWGSGAMTHAVRLSQEKYRLAHWLETIGASSGFYNSSRHLDFAMDRTEAHTVAYMAEHRRHFRYYFPQSVALLILYAVASAGLLAMAGYLVINEQLSIGQLVAAELILASVFYGAAQLGPYLDSFYDMVAGLEELNLFLGIPQEVVPDPSRTKHVLPSGALVMNGVRVRDDFGTVEFNLTLPEHVRLVAAAEPGVERLFGALLKRHQPIEAGVITLGGADVAEFDVYELRSDIKVLTRPTIVEASIRDYLALACPTRDPVRTMAALKTVGLDDRIAQLRDGMDTVLATNGSPLSPAEVMALKLAGAITAEPHILVLSSLYDTMPVDRLQVALEALGQRGVSILYFSNRPHDVTLDGYLWLGRGEQKLLADRAAFDAVRSTRA